jgi:hypothetical protein
MSLLKQSVLAQVVKGENVLNSFDAGDSGATEGFVYQCRWSAKEYDPATAAGFNIVVGDLIRFTTIDDLGGAHTSILEAQSSFNLVKNGDLAAIDTTATSSTEMEAFDADGLYKKNNQYFKRSYEIFTGGANDSTTTDAYVDENILVSDKTLIPALLTSDIVAAAFTGGGTVDALDYTFAGTGGHRRFTAPYFGKISATSVVPSGAWFYYAGDDIGAGTAPSAAGYYLNSTGANVDFTSASTFTDAIFADQSAVVGSGLASYVWALNTGATQVILANATGYALESTEVADLLDAAQITRLADPSASNEYWEEIPALAAPLQFSNGVATATDSAVLDITTANELTDLGYWNRISENFIEDYDQSVGSGGVSGADSGGVYAGSYVATGNSTTVRALEIETFASAQATTDAVVTITNHGLTDGDTIVISNVDVVYDGSFTIDVINDNQFRLDSTAGRANISYSSGGIATENGSKDLVWRETFPPTTDQTLLYRY